MKRCITRAVVVLLLTFGEFVTPAAYGQTHSEDAARFVGAWEYVMSERRQEDGTWARVEGSAAPERIGVIMYTASGHMAVQIMRRNRGSSGGYTAYFGTYEVNAQEGFIIHHRTGHLNPDAVGDDAKRFYVFADDTLTLTVAPASRSRLTWRRLP